MFSKFFFVFAIFLFLTTEIFAQKFSVDTMRANSLLKKAISFEKSKQFDSTIACYQKSYFLYSRHWGKKSKKSVEILEKMASTFQHKFDYNRALVYYLNVLELQKEIFGAKSVRVSDSYNNIGMVFWSQSQYENALENYLKGLEIRKEIFGDKHTKVADSYLNIGLVYHKMNEYDKALEYCLKSLEILKKIYGENHPDVAKSYNTIGVLYKDKTEYNKALEYYFKSLKIRREIFGEKHLEVAMSYNNIGTLYYLINENEKSLEYHFKALEIRKEIFGEKHFSTANSYLNIGVVYNQMDDYDKALEHHFKALNIRREILGEKNIEICASYHNIGSVYQKKSEYDKALEYYFKALRIRKILLGEKNISVARTYNNIGESYKLLYKFDTALIYYRKAMSSNLRDFNFDSTKTTFRLPQMKNYYELRQLLMSLDGCAECLVGMGEKNRGLFFEALSHYQAADTLILQTRDKVSNEKDKLVSADIASRIYEKAVPLCFRVSDFPLAFYFSEKNKSRVLLASMQEAKAKKNAGIPQNLLQQEKEIKMNIALYERLLLEKTDSASQKLFNNLLFVLHQKHDSLISVFENKYPKYFKSKYKKKTLQIADLQKILRKKEMVRSYLVTDSVIYIFTITKEEFKIDITKMIRTVLDEKVDSLREVLQSGKQKNVLIYQKLAFELYQKLFPDSLSLKKLEKLIIIPDGTLGAIPFEALLTEKYEGNWKEFLRYPYLIKKFEIVYSYSTDLFYQTATKKMTNKNSTFLGLAPVFAEESKKDSAKRLIRNDLVITPLPGTEDEIKNISKLFQKNWKKSVIKTHSQASESFLKTTNLKDFRYLQFATHGIFDLENPELSCILLATDSTGNEDGTLYAGEIYGLELDADLVILSACVTGLGKFNHGEGVIGLTRALMYAGATNATVSLWEVSDESTSQLMLYFYEQILKNPDKLSTNLQRAKLRMIFEIRFAAPYFWSPFVLIGK